MPIHGLTADTSRPPHLGRIGVLRKGAPHTGKGPGKDLDYFRFTSEKPEIVQAFIAAYGEKPTELSPIYLPYDLLNDNFSSWREEWVAGGMVHRCDGQWCSVWREGAGYSTCEYGQEIKPCPYADQPDEEKKCRPIGRLTVILPKLWMAGYVGYVTLLTSSKHDLMHIRDVLAGMKQVQGVGFRLYRESQMISGPDGKGSRARRSHSLVFIEPEAAWVRKQIADARAGALGDWAGREVPELIAPDETVDKSTGEIVEQPVVEAPKPEPKPKRRRRSATKTEAKVEPVVKTETTTKTEAKPATPPKHPGKPGHWTSDASSRIHFTAKVKRLELDTAAIEQRLGLKEGEAISDTNLTLEQAMAALDVELIETGAEEDAAF